METIGRTINAAIGGIREGKFTKDGRRYDVRIRLNPEQRLDADAVKQLTVRTSYGEIIPLSEVVKLETVKTLQAISRVNRQRSISVTANLAPGASQSTALAETERIAREVMPAGYTFNLEGGAKTFEESFQSLWFAFLLGLIVAYMVLASQFNSLLHPVAIMTSLPLSLIGVFLALFIFRGTLNIFSIIGIVMLMGLVTKNAILLIDFIKVATGNGVARTEAIMQAGRTRLRPILMTTSAMVMGMIPLALGLGEGAEQRAPMAHAIIGGIITSTLLTLVVVPVIYTYLDDATQWAKRVLGMQASA